MILEETINKLIRDVINLILDVPDFSIKSKQNAPRPVGPYGDVDFVADRSVGWEQRELVDNTGDPDITETISGVREITLALGFYREGAMDNARRVRIALVRQSVSD